MYVGANALVAVFSYLVIVGPIKRIELREDPSKNGNAQTQPTAGALAETRR
ncbi:hypothetical protein D3C73_1613390 [compost metagenome]